MQSEIANILVITPASGLKARERFSRTISKRWTLSEILRLGVDLPGQIIELLNSARNFAIWGSTPRPRGITQFFERLERARGGVVAFYREGRVICWGRIFAWLRSRELAEKLWGRDEGGQTWEYVYFIKDLRCCEPGIPWDIVRRELGYSESFVPQGHIFVDPRRLEGIDKKYGDTFRFFEFLAKENRACLKGSNEEMDVTLIRLLKELKPNELLEALGRVSIKLAKKRSESLSKDEITDLVTEVLREMGLEKLAVYKAR